MPSVDHTVALLFSFGLSVTHAQPRKPEPMGAVPIEIVSESVLAPIVKYTRLEEMMREAQRQGVAGLGSEPWCSADFFLGLAALGSVRTGPPDQLSRHAGRAKLRDFADSNRGDAKLRQLARVYSAPTDSDTHLASEPFIQTEQWYAQVLVEPERPLMPHRLQTGWRPDYETSGIYAALMRRAVGWVLFRAGRSHAVRQEGAIMLEGLLGQGVHWKEQGLHKGQMVEALFWDINVYRHLTEVTAWRARQAIDNLSLPSGCKHLLLGRVALLLGRRKEAMRELASSVGSAGPCARSAGIWQRTLQGKVPTRRVEEDPAALAAFIRSGLGRPDPTQLLTATEEIYRRLIDMGISERDALSIAGQLRGEVLLAAGKLQEAQTFLDDLRLKTYRLRRVRGGIHGAIRIEDAQPAIEVLGAYTYFRILRDGGDAHAARRLRLVFLDRTAPAYELVPELRDLDEHLARWWYRLQ